MRQKKCSKVAMLLFSLYVDTTAHWFSVAFIIHRKPQRDGGKKGDREREKEYHFKDV